MLTTVQRKLDDFCFILASASPRRLQLLEQLAGFKNRITVIPSSFNEDLDPSKYSSPAEYAIATSYEKALEVARRPNNNFSQRHVIISADTVVACDGKILEKPKDEADSFSMLQSLSGRSHLVHTGVTLGFFDPTPLKKYHGGGLTKYDNPLYSVVFSVTTKVNFFKLTEAIIGGYVATGEGLDKAGSYGIQGIGSTLIDSIEGDFYNVVGLPLPCLCQQLYKIFEDF